MENFKYLEFMTHQIPEILNCWNLQKWYYVKVVSSPVTKSKYP